MSLCMTAVVTLRVTVTITARATGIIGVQFYTWLNLPCEGFSIHIHHHNYVGHGEQDCQ